MGVATVLEFADGEVGAGGDDVGLHLGVQLLGEPAADGGIVLLSISNMKKHYSR